VSVRPTARTSNYDENTRSGMPTTAPARRATARAQAARAATPIPALSRATTRTQAARATTPTPVQSRAEPNQSEVRQMNARPTARTSNYDENTRWVTMPRPRAASARRAHMRSEPSDTPGEHTRDHHRNNAGVSRQTGNRRPQTHQNRARRHQTNQPPQAPTSHPEEHPRQRLSKCACPSHRHH